MRDPDYTLIGKEFEDENGKISKVTGYTWNHADNCWQIHLESRIRIPFGDFLKPGKYKETT